MIDKIKKVYKKGNFSIIQQNERGKLGFTIKKFYKNSKKCKRKGIFDYNFLFFPLILLELGLKTVISDDLSEYFVEI